LPRTASNYSLQNTVRHALLLPTSREAKYKAKAAIETFCVRLGDVLQAAVVFLGTTVGLSIRGFAGISLVVTALWIWTAIAIYRRHKVIAPVYH
jgi:AAA family ATP:ADP antiporter